jgi:fused signal recognition particle receptor
MLKLFRQKKKDEAKNSVAMPVTEQETELAKSSEDIPNSQSTVPPKQSLFSRLKSSLKKTRTSFGEGLANLFLGKKQIDEDVLEELETALLQADLGIDATTEIISSLSEKVKRSELNDPDALLSALRMNLCELLESVEKPLKVPENLGRPYVILMVGINGAGKTTTIGKLAARFQKEGKSVMLAAGDTFRAAAVEQLQAWGERNQVPVVAQHTGADSASVVFDAFQSAKAKKVDVLIADTAGRLHTQSNLMDELKKVKKVIQKIEQEAPDEVMLVLDAGTGQNALNQAREFLQAVEVSGLVMTKLDGTAKGGMLFALARTLKLPIRFIGLGEGIDDLKPLDSKLFVDALFEKD